MDPVFGTPIAHWTSFKAAPRLAESACLQRPWGHFFNFFYWPVFGSCASAPADPGHKIANPQMPGPFFWVVLGGGKGPRLLRGVPACGTPPDVRFLVSCGACAGSLPRSLSPGVGRNLRCWVLAGRPTDAKRSKRTAHGNTLLCGGIILPYPL